MEGLLCIPMRTLSCGICFDASVSNMYLVCVERKGRATSSANNGSHPDTPVKGERNIDFFLCPLVCMQIHAPHSL